MDRDVANRIATALEKIAAVVTAPEKAEPEAPANPPKKRAARSSKAA